MEKDIDEQQKNRKGLYKNTQNCLQQQKIQIESNKQCTQTHCITPSNNSVNIQFLHISQSNLNQLKNVFELQYSNLLQYRVQKPKQNKKIPLPNSQSLQKIYIISDGQSEIVNAVNLSNNYYQKLKQLELHNIKNNRYFDWVVSNILCWSLQRLVINRNIIRDISKILSELYVNLKHLDLKENQLDEFKNIYAPNLVYLSCQNNYIQDLGSFTQIRYPQLQQLQHLNFSGNQLINLPKLNIPKLKVLNLQRNQIKQLQHFSEGKYQFLQQLNLNANKISIFLPISMPKIRTIDLARNEITKIDWQYIQSNYLNLKSINLNCNSCLIQSKSLQLPDIISHKSLQKLSLKTNKIQKIIQLRTPNLKQLYLNENLLQDINFLTKFSFDNIQKIDLCKNNISSLPKINCKNIKYLNISENRLTEIQKQFFQQEYQCMEYLDLSRRKYGVGQLKDKVLRLEKLKMKNLKVLKVNSIERIDLDEFFKGQYPQLVQLIISDLKDNISKLPKLNMSNLKTLQAWNTNLKNINQFLQGKYLSLIYVQLKNQYLQFIDSPKQKGNYQMLILYEPTNQPIIAVPPVHHPILKQCISTTILLKQLKIDLSIVKSSQFISFLNLAHVKLLQVSNNRFSHFINKNLVKVNFQRCKNLLFINLSQKSNIKLFQGQTKTTQQDINNNLLYFHRYNNWSRFYNQKKPFTWTYKSEIILRPEQTYCFKQHSTHLFGLRLRQNKNK